MDEKKIYIGLMSGTSVDAIDAAAVCFPDNQSGKKVEILDTHSHAIPADIKKEIITLNQTGENELHRCMTLDMKLGELFSEASHELMTKLKLSAQQVTAIASHGQTIRHQVNEAPHYTLQIANPHVIAQRTGILTVADFRTRDMVVGGQGAPLAPAFHQALFTSKSIDRVILNIGGMANLTFLWADARPVQGFDTGPGNVLMNTWIKHEKNQDYDNHGEWALSGTVNKQLLSAFLSDDYFQKSPPKSTGREMFDEPWLRKKLTGVKESPENIQATLLAVTALSITNAIKNWGPEKGEIYVCGGGAHNSALLEKISETLPTFKVLTTSALGLEPDWVESCAFAWFAHQTLSGNKNKLKSITGASIDTISGCIYPV